MAKKAQNKERLSYIDFKGIKSPKFALKLS